MRDDALRALERRKDEAPDDLLALRRWADARKRAGLELLPVRCESFVIGQAEYLGSGMALVRHRGSVFRIPVQTDRSLYAGALGIVFHDAVNDRVLFCPFTPARPNQWVDPLQAPRF